MGTRSFADELRALAEELAGRGPEWMDLANALDALALENDRTEAEDAVS